MIPFCRKLGNLYTVDQQSGISWCVGDFAGFQILWVYGERKKGVLT